MMSRYLHDEFGTISRMANKNPLVLVTAITGTHFDICEIMYVTTPTEKLEADWDKLSVYNVESQ